MVNIESIKQKILQLDAGSFQNLCDSYLYKTGYQGIVSLGGETGTRKTTLGTPDTYFTTSNGMYVFVEYTTQRTKLFVKIKNDLKKCLDATSTGVPHDRISEIIYCHTSSNITPDQDSKVKKLCEDVGVKLTLIGIDKLAEDIYLFHHNLSRDFLGISISTDQIQSFDEFISCYNSNRMSAPIDTKFLFREKELQDIIHAYQKVDVVILSGSSGAGKTRLALHYVKNYAYTKSEKNYCIRSNSLPIYEDLKLFLDKPGDYFLFIDDANQLSGLKHVIRFVSMKPEGYNVKVLITVRNYALQKVINDVREITCYEIVNVNLFSDNEIKELLETSLGILNLDYQERIIRIAEGNARIAILAGKVACSSNRLESIDDVSQLYEDYYGSNLEDRYFFIDKNLCITAGIIAFLEAIHLDYIDTLLPVLQEKGLSRDAFIENIHMLHEQEVVDIYNDKAVRFSDQCLSNYLLKYIFFDKKLLSLSKIIKTCFLSQNERTVFSVSTLLTIFRNKELINFVEKEIKLLWDELSTEDSPIFFEFVKAFFRINPTETLLLLQNKIESEERVIFEWSDIDIEKRKSYQHVENDIINILGGFADMTDLPSACDLFFQYYLKRPDLFMEFYHAANKFFGIDRETIRYNFCTQIIFFEKIEEYSDGWKQESIASLFLQIAEEFLKLYFSPAEEGRKNTLTIYHIPLTMSEGVEKYRKLIWKSLFSLSEVEKYRVKVREILWSYGGAVDDVSTSVLQFDLKYIKLIMKTYFLPNQLINCLLADKIIQVFSMMNCSCENLFSEYLGEENFQLYRLLKGPEYNEVGYDEREKLKKQTINHYTSNGDLQLFKKIIDVCSSISKLDNHSSWQIDEGLNIAFESIFNKKDLYIDAIKYYIKSNTPYNLCPYHLVDTLFSLLSDSEVYELIIGEEYSQKNTWIYAYYHELPLELITEKHLQDLYSFLKDSSDRYIPTSSMRDVDFLEKYNIVDESAFIESCKIILNKKEYSLYIVNVYFDLLINCIHNSPKEVIQKFNGDLDLLEEIYYHMLRYNKHFDYDGQLLKEIYIVKSSILDKYIDYLINYGSFTNHKEKNCCFFELDDFVKIYNKIFEQMIINRRDFKLFIPNYLESFLLPKQNDKKMLEKQDIWIRQCIQRFYSDDAKMYCLFSVVSKLEAKRKKEYILFFLEHNSLVEDFKKIPLIPTSWTWSGSIVPTYFAWIEFLESLLPNFIGLKWIKHKNYIEMKIRVIKEQIELEQIDEILRG